MTDFYTLPGIPSDLMTTEVVGTRRLKVDYSGGVLSAGEEMYAKRVDFEGDTIYRGEAAVGALESALVWRIRRIELAVDGDVTEMWANGTADFTHAWADRLALEYS